MVARAWSALSCGRRARVDEHDPEEDIWHVVVEEPPISTAWPRFAIWAIERKAKLLSIRIAQILFSQSGVRLQNLSADEETFATCRAFAKKIFATRGRQLRNIPKEERTLCTRVQAFQFKP
jgi:hypothetical protein